jgi:hypothetical protein
MKKQFLTVILLLGATIAFAQNVEVKGLIIEGSVDTTRGTFKKIRYRAIAPENALSFNLGYGIPMIIPTLGTWTDWNLSPGMGLSFGIDYKHHLFETKIVNNEEVKKPKILGFGVGVGVSYLSKRAVMDDHPATTPNFTDKDGDVCNVSVSYKGVKEKVSLTYLDIPLYLEIGKPSQVRLSGYFDIGVKASILIADKFTGEGTYTSTGFYEKIGGKTANVTVHDVDELNYYTNRKNYIDPLYDLPKFVLWGCLSGGISIPFSSLEKNKVSSCILRLGARVDYSILPISETINSSFSFTTQSNMLGLNKSSHVCLFGFDVKLIYCF